MVEIVRIVLLVCIGLIGSGEVGNALYYREFHPDETD